MTPIVIGRQFRGPPNSGNGGYVCGVLAKGLEGPATAVLRAPIPLDRELKLARQDEAVLMLGEGDAVIGQAGPAKVELPDPPPAPSLAAAREAAARYVGHERSTHPICFTCGTDRQEGDGLRVFPGQVAGAPAGVVACDWTPHACFAEADGTVAPEVVWAALDCPGYFAWVELEGRHGALLGTMTGEIVRAPKAGETCIVVAWPLERQGRKELAGTALFSAEGELLARAHQVWIVMGPAAQSQAA